MAIDEGVLVHNSGDGTMNVHGPVVGGNGNQVTVSQAAAVPAGTGELLRVLTGIRLTAASATDLPSEIQARVLGGAAEAQRFLAAGDPVHVATVLLRTRAALEPARGITGTATALREMLESAMDLVPGD